MGAAISQGFTFLLAKVVALARWFGELFVKVFEALWHMVTDLVCWAFDGFLGIAVSALGVLDFSAFTQYLGLWASLPGGVIEVLEAIALAQAVGIVIAAIGIRLVLQLIPFTRLGS
ncbi:MAG TPA: DUF2523 family protein [Acidimicrobiales bacterium]|nr:DUF2523 family protein [Acidimicrobiales bacterium]